MLYCNLSKKSRGMMLERSRCLAAGAEPGEKNLNLRSMRKAIPRLVEMPAESQSALTQWEVEAPRCSILAVRSRS